jgi:hypothetical protein
VAKAVTEAPEVPVAREEPVAAAGMALLATAFQVDLEMAEGAGIAVAAGEVAGVAMVETAEMAGMARILM